jgi:hypothetical protein
MKQVLVARRKGRIPGAFLGTLFLGPAGFLAGGLLGTRTEITLEEKPTLQERAVLTKAQRAARPPSRLGKYIGFFFLLIMVVVPLIGGVITLISNILGL